MDSVAERWSDMGEGEVGGSRWGGIGGGRIPVTAAAGDAETYLDT